MPHWINDKCNGCSACMRQCPADAIWGEFGGRYYIDENMCIDCGVCGMICPLSAVVDQCGDICFRVTRSNRLRPVVNANICNGCGLCIDFCPASCRYLASGRYHWGISALSNIHACTSCGECSLICIKSAISMETLDLAAHDPHREQEIAVGLCND